MKVSTSASKFFACRAAVLWDLICISKYYHRQVGSVSTVPRISCDKRPVFYDSSRWRYSGMNITRPKSQ